MRSTILDPAHLRAWWAHRQGLDASLSSASAAEVLERTGWARSVGGTGPYLTLFSRAGVSREAADTAVAQLLIHELPAARGCTYVLPATHYALALSVGATFNVSNDRKTAIQLGATEAELDKLCARVLEALKAGPLDPEQIKAATGSAVRNFGEAGKKKGLTTSLPVALSTLQSAGEIRRISLTGRLDTQRFKYALWRPNPCHGFKLNPQEALAQLARLYWKWTGPATLAEFQWFSGCGVKAIKQAVDPLGLVPLDTGSPRLILPADRDALLSFRVPKDPRWALISSLDGLALLRRNVQDLLPDPNARFPLMHGLSDLPSNAIIDRGTLAGLWEFDPAAGDIAWMTFARAPKTLEAEVARTAEFIQTQLGDARSFSLDTPKARAPRIEALRRAGR